MLTKEKINHKRNVPDNSVYLILVVAGILCLTFLVSTFAFDSIVSLTLLALLSTYMISIGRACGSMLLRLVGS